jgi:hypothetical protein
MYVDKKARLVINDETGFVPALKLRIRLLYHQLLNFNS